MQEDRLQLAKAEKTLGASVGISLKTPFCEVPGSWGERFGNRYVPELAHVV